VGCISCGRGFHFECETGCESCHLTEEQKFRELRSVPNSGGVVKEPEDVKDRHSTGRKRAAELYPIIKHRACEWQGKKNCGGGIPIVGCINGLQRARHHGPIKDTLENSPGNVHRICHTCHNRWHTINDDKYVEAEWVNTKHEPQKAEEIELLANEAYWRSKNLKIIKEPVDDH
jgi:hypothetical protein